MFSDGCRYYRSRMAEHTTQLGEPPRQPRHHHTQSLSSVSEGASGCWPAPQGSIKPPSFMSPWVFFYNLLASDRKWVVRYLITYPFLTGLWDGSFCASCFASHASSVCRLSCSTYDGDQEELVGPEVTHIVMEVDTSVHTQVSFDVSRGSFCFHMNEELLFFESVLICINRN